MLRRPTLGFLVLIFLALAPASTLAQSNSDIFNLLTPAEDPTISTTSFLL